MREWPRTFRVASFVMAAAFASFALLQFNDPDPARWIAVYGMAAVVSGLAALLGSIRWFLPAPLAAVAVLWGGALAAGVLGRHVDPGQVFGTMRMIDSSVEETREALGLVIVGAWTGYLSWRALRQRRRSTR